MGLRSLGLAGLGVSLGWVCEPMNVQNRVSDLLCQEVSTLGSKCISLLKESETTKYGGPAGDSAVVLRAKVCIPSFHDLSLTLPYEVNRRGRRITGVRT